MKRAPGDSRRIWTAPLVLGAMALVGLVGALLADDGVWDVLAGLSLFATIAYPTMLGFRNRRRPS